MARFQVVSEEIETRLTSKVKQGSKVYVQENHRFSVFCAWQRRKDDDSSLQDNESGSGEQELQSEWRGVKVNLEVSPQIKPLSRAQAIFYRPSRKATETNQRSTRFWSSPHFSFLRKWAIWETRTWRPPNTRLKEKVTLKKDGRFS